MNKNGVLGRAFAIGSALAASLLLTLAAPTAASADPTRTLNLYIYCATGEAYGLQVNTGAGFYQPDGSSTVVNGVKYFTVSIPASATTLWVMPILCGGQLPAGSGPVADFHPYQIPSGTSTINATASCQDYPHNYGAGPSVMIYDCSLFGITYS